MEYGMEQPVRLKERVETLFFSLNAVVLFASAAMLFFLAYAKRELFSAIDPALFVCPFLGYTFSILCAVLSMGFIALHAHSRPQTLPGLSLARLWLYPATALGFLAVLLFAVATGYIAYLIIL